MLTLRQIEVFRAVMRAGTLVGAARELGIAQPTTATRRFEVYLHRVLERQQPRFTLPFRDLLVKGAVDSGKAMP